MTALPPYLGSDLKVLFEKLLIEVKGLRSDVQEIKKILKNLSDKWPSETGHREVVFPPPIVLEEVKIEEKPTAPKFLPEIFRPKRGPFQPEVQPMRGPFPPYEEDAGPGGLV